MSGSTDQGGNFSTLTGLEQAAKSARAPIMHRSLNLNLTLSFCLIYLLVYKEKVIQIFQNQRITKEFFYE